MVVTHACALLVAALLLGSLGATRAVASNDTWRAPLADKAEAFERNVLERHWIDGLYPSMVEVAADGSVDFTTAGHANVAHSINWTAYYLAGECYRWLATQDPEAREHCDQILEAIYRCQLVTGVRGLQARGYVHGHGPSYEERADAGHSNDWYQGEGEYSNYRWRGSPSHHNYSGGAYAFGMYYDLVAEGEQKDRAREAIDALVGYWADQENFVIRKRDGSMSAPILGFTDGKTPNTRIIMAASALRTAHHLTGKQLYLDKYTELTEQYHFRTWRTCSASRKTRSCSDSTSTSHATCGTPIATTDSPPSTTSSTGTSPTTPARKRRSLTRCGRCIASQRIAPSGPS
jgi:hypothetical protein